MKVRLLKKNELIKFQNLVKKNYKKNHILSKSKKLINFYYNYRGLQKLNLIGMFNKRSQLLSVIGLISYKNWDKNLLNDYFIAFWVKKKKLENSLFLIKYIFLKIQPKFLATTGINKKTSGKIFEYFSKIKLFNNFFIKNNSQPNKIGKNLNNKKYNDLRKIKLNLICNIKINQLPNYNYYPKKSLAYFNNKYIKNPFYKYFVLNFFYKKELKFFFICREIKIKKLNSKIIRIIDFYGNIDNKFSIYSPVMKFLKKNKYEYIDFLSIGLDNKLINLGFTKKSKKMFIPEYFEPFERVNSKNFCILKNDYKANVILVKGDGDGDRPNLL